MPIWRFPREKETMRWFLFHEWFTICLHLFILLGTTVYMLHVAITGLAVFFWKLYSRLHTLIFFTSGRWDNCIVFNVLPCVLYAVSWFKEMRGFWTNKGWAAFLPHHVSSLNVCSAAGRSHQSGRSTQFNNLEKQRWPTHVKYRTFWVWTWYLHLWQSPASACFALFAKVTFEGGPETI